MTTVLDTDTLVPALLSAADQHATGELSTSLPDGGPAQVFLREGQVYGVVVRDGGRTLGELLVNHGALTRDDLDFALEAQRRDLPGWRIGELLVHLGYVTADQVQACLCEQIQEMLGWLLAQPPTPWHMQRGSRTRYALAPPLDVPWLLTTLGVGSTTPSRNTALLAVEEPAAPALSPADMVQLAPVAPVDIPLDPEPVAALEDVEVVDALVVETADTDTADTDIAVERGDVTDDGMVRSDALATLSALYAEDGEEDEPRAQTRSVFGFLRSEKSGKKGREGKRRLG